jgi:hypothetical protein
MGQKYHADMGRIEARTANRRLAQWRVKWLIEHSTSHQLLWCIDSFVLRNPVRTQRPETLRCNPSELHGIGNARKPS